MDRDLLKVNKNSVVTCTFCLTYSVIHFKSKLNCILVLKEIKSKKSIVGKNNYSSEETSDDKFEECK